MVIKNKNFSHQVTPDTKDETTFERCNFTQEQPVLDKTTGKMKGVRLWPGDNTPRTFIECNLCNCEVPAGSTILRSNTSIFERDLEEGTRDVTIGDETVTVTKKLSRSWGRFNPETEKIDYFETPKEILETSEEEQMLQEKAAKIAEVAKITTKFDALVAQKILERKVIKDPIDVVKEI